jgi:hypothetical protein
MVQPAMVTFAGAICSNGNLYCPATPPALLALVPLARDASAPEIAVHDQTTAELAHYKLARLGADDQDGYHRVACPAVMGKLRCPRRPASMTLSHERPTVLSLPEGTTPVLWPADLDRPRFGQRQDGPKIRLPLGRLAGLLCPAQRP